MKKKTTTKKPTIGSLNAKNKMLKEMMVFFASEHEIVDLLKFLWKKWIEIVLTFVYDKGRAKSWSFVVFFLYFPKKKILKTIKAKGIWGRKVKLDFTLFIVQHLDSSK